MANMIIKKGKFAIENNGKIDQMWANIVTEDEVTQVCFIVETKKEDKMNAFRDQLAQYIADYRSKGKIVNPFA